MFSFRTFGLPLLYEDPELQLADLLDESGEARITFEEFEPEIGENGVCELALRIGSRPDNCISLMIPDHDLKALRDLLGLMIERNNCQRQRLKEWKIANEK